MDDIILEIQKNLNDAILNAAAEEPIKQIKKVYYWDPVLIAKQFMPALVIMPASESITSRSNKQDEDNLVLNISYVYNIKDSFGSDDNKKVTWIQEAVQLLTWRNCKSGSFKKNSIIWILRKNFYINDNATLQNEVAVNYNFDLVDNKPVFKATLTVAFKIIANI